MRISVINSSCYIDFDDWKVVVTGEDGDPKDAVEITQPQIYKVLEFFAEHPGEYFSKRQLLKECWDIEIAEGDSSHDNNFYSQIACCKNLIGDVLENKRKRGYRYNGEKITESRVSGTALDMTDVRGFCIGDADPSGCQVRREESGPDATTAVVDFSLTDSKLCSVVYFTGQRDWSRLAADHSLCFEARATPGPVRAEVEVRLSGHDMAVPVLLREEPGTCRIPMKTFASPQAWEDVQEIHLLFHQRAVSARTSVTIQNLRLER